MATWQQHALSNAATNNANQSLATQGSSVGLNSTEVSDILGEINHTSSLSGDFGNLFNQSEYSDIELVVESERFHAHRIILAARSEYFRALLYGGLRESRVDNHTIEIKECKAAAFKILLLYIYTGRVNLIKEKEDILLDLLGLVHQYGFQQLETSLSTYLKSILSLKNVCTIYDTSCLYELDSLKHRCAQFIDGHASDIIKTEEFLTLSSDAFASIIARDSFYCPEIDIFHAVKNWHEYHYREQDQNWTPLDGIVSKVRLTLMSMNELLKVVRYSNLFDLNHLMDAIDSINDETIISTPLPIITPTGDESSISSTPTTPVISSNKQLVSCRSKDKKFRGRLRLDENIATKAHHAQVTEGEIKHALLDGDITSYDLDRGFTRHPIDDIHNISVKLDGPSIINHIKLLLWDKDTRAYSYYVEVSVDDNSWTRVIDYRAYLCRSWQKLYFAPIVATSIRIVGTHNSVNKVFHLVAMEVCYTQKPFALVGDILAPTQNVATLEASAVVSEGVSRVRNALINGDYLAYDWDSGYTCHQLGSGGIVIQLCQPHVVSSMRLLLWDCDNRSYSYYIETSYDNITWSKAVDRHTVACKSWQILTFDPRIVVFVRICGTHNTANEVFHCVHFECPCRPDVLKLYMSEHPTTGTAINERETSSVTYDEFYQKLEPLLDLATSNSSSMAEKTAPTQSHTLLPFTVKNSSGAVFALEPENNETSDESIRSPVVL